jgi:hypothetical protein
MGRAFNSALRALPVPCFGLATLYLLHRKREFKRGEEKVHISLHFKLPTKE